MAEPQAGRLVGSIGRPVILAALRCIQHPSRRHFACREECTMSHPIVGSRSSPRRPHEAPRARPGQGAAAVCGPPATSRSSGPRSRSSANRSAKWSISGRLLRARCRVRERKRGDRGRPPLLQRDGARLCVPALLAQADEQLKNLAIEFVEGDAEQLPFPTAAFDYVLSTFGAMFAPDQRRVARELLRVCRPGGTSGSRRRTPEGSSGTSSASWPSVLRRRAAFRRRCSGGPGTRLRALRGQRQKPDRAPDLRVPLQVGRAFHPKCSAATTARRTRRSSPSRGRRRPRRSRRIATLLHQVEPRPRNRSLTVPASLPRVVIETRSPG